MYVCHSLNYVEMTLTQIGKSLAYNIFTSSASVNMVLELDRTIFHSHENFMWPLTGAITYGRIMSLVISNPSYFDNFLIYYFYCLIS